MPPGMRRKESFNTVADLYDRFRFAPPPEVLQDVVASAALHAGARVLEIGCGTGQLSVPLASRGILLLAVELGPSLAEIARRRLVPFPNAQVLIAAFETWPLPDKPFDAVISSNAFHWLDPSVRITKSLAALRPGGTLIIVHPHHVEGGTPGFFQSTQPYYAKWGLSSDPMWRPATVAETPFMYTELDSAPGVSHVERHRFEITRRFTTHEHIGLLHTDSLIISLPAGDREAFLAGIAHVIDSCYGGAIERCYLYEVVVAQKQAH